MKKELIENKYITEENFSLEITAPFRCPSKYW